MTREGALGDFGHVGRQRFEMFAVAEPAARLGNFLPSFGHLTFQGEAVPQSFNASLSAVMCVAGREDGVASSASACAESRRSLRLVFASTT